MHTNAYYIGFFCLFQTLGHTPISLISVQIATGPQGHPSISSHPNPATKPTPPPPPELFVRGASLSKYILRLSLIQPAVVSHNTYIHLLHVLS